MGGRRRPRTRAGGGEQIPTLHPARDARVATALAALGLLAALAALVLADAGSESELAWLGAGTAALSLTAGMLVSSTTAVHAAVALLGGIFLLRQESRLLLASPYGAGLLLMEDLAVQAIELRGGGRVAVDVIAARTAAVLAIATLGACAAAAAALAVTAASDRSVAMTALGAMAAVAALAAIVRLARRRYGVHTVAAAWPRSESSRASLSSTPRRHGSASPP
jgi:hypothetical protein